MLESLRGNASERKLRLFAAACCRRVWLRTDPRLREAIRTAEEYADGEVRPSTLRNALRYCGGGEPSLVWGPELSVDHVNAAVRAATGCIVRVAEAGRRDPERAAQAALLRDLFGQLYHSFTADPAWLAWNGGTVVRVAEAVYRQREWDRLPILADALEEAGCDDADLLDHCRSAGEHARGCWALDVLLTKS